MGRVSSLNTMNDLFGIRGNICIVPTYSFEGSFVVHLIHGIRSLFTRNKGIYESYMILCDLVFHIACDMSLIT